MFGKLFPDDILNEQNYRDGLVLKGGIFKNAMDLLQEINLYRDEINEESDRSELKGNEIQSFQSNENYVDFIQNPESNEFIQHQSLQNFNIYDNPLFNLFQNSFELDDEKIFFDHNSNIGDFFSSYNNYTEIGNNLEILGVGRENENEIIGSEINYEMDINCLKEAIEKQISIDQNNSDLKKQKSKKKISKSNGDIQYRYYSKETKKLLINAITSGASFCDLNKEFKIPQKNLRRWKKNGIERKSGCGRKPFYKEMEKKLLAWCLNEKKTKNLKRIPRASIQIKAKELVKIYNPNCKFEASKGWMDRFMKRQDLRNKLQNL